MTQLRGSGAVAFKSGYDTLLSLATIDGSCPAVRTVNSYYEDGAFYTVTYALSNKMKQIEKNPEVAICGEWVTRHIQNWNILKPNIIKLLYHKVILIIFMFKLAKRQLLMVVKHNGYIIISYIK